MTTAPTTPITFLSETANWIRGRSIYIYCQGREKPIADVMIKHVGRQSLVGRWNGSTHLIPLASIAYIRFGKDYDPIRNIHHPLHTTMNDRNHTPRKHPVEKLEDPAGVMSITDLAAATAHTIKDKEPQPPSQTR